MSSEHKSLLKNCLPWQATTQVLEETLRGADDGELFLEHTVTEGLQFEERTLVNASHNTTQGFGLRAVSGEATFYAHSPNITLQEIQKAAQLRKVLPNKTQSIALDTQNTASTPSCPELAHGDIPFTHKVGLLQNIDTFARDLDSRVTQVGLSYSVSHQEISVLRLDQEQRGDTRLFARLPIRITVEENGRFGKGYVSLASRKNPQAFFDTTYWQAKVREAVRCALLQLRAVDAPSGAMPVILGPGIPGVLLHEAVGHGLEGDFNRKGHSIFADQMGKVVASPMVTVVDEGHWDMDLPHNHGSLAIDDEGTPTGRTVLIENGILRGHMCDRLNGRLMGKSSTGNGRRQSYAHIPMPRMTNTYMENGTSSLSDMLAGIKRGVYAVGFSGGQVDIVSGNFVFSTSESYLIENGEITVPLKEATLIGNGPDTMKKIETLGSDLALDSSGGHCGKSGQTVQVGLGQPSCRISELTVGGTAA